MLYLYPLRTPLRCAAGLRQSGTDFFCSFPGINSSARKRASDMPGYFQPSLAGLAHSARRALSSLQSTRRLLNSVLSLIRLDGGDGSCDTCNSAEEPSADRRDQRIAQYVAEARIARAEA